MVCPIFAFGPSEACQGLQLVFSLEMRHTIITEKEKKKATIIVVVGATYIGEKMVQRGVL